MPSITIPWKLVQQTAQEGEICADVCARDACVESGSCSWAVGNCGTICFHLVLDLLGRAREFTGRSCSSGDSALNGSKVDEWTKENVADLGRGQRFGSLSVRVSCVSKTFGFITNFLPSFPHFLDTYEHFLVKE